MPHAMSFVEALHKAENKLDRQIFDYEPADDDFRCETCLYGGGRYGDRNCGLFELVNRTLPVIFSLDQKIDPAYRCNAWTTP